MNTVLSLGFSWSSDELTFPQTSQEPKKPPFMLRKLMPQYVYDLVHLEGNPYSFVDVQTLIDGAVVEGYSAFDQMQVLNQHKSLLFLLQVVPVAEMQLGKKLACAFHARLAREEALEWGKFRSSQVHISGTDHIPPPHDNLEELYAVGLAEISRIEHPFERALIYFFWAAQQQFFFDGNKRCARAMMNYILLANGYYYLSVPAKKAAQFDQMMVSFYDSKDASSGMAWLLECYQEWG